MVRGLSGYISRNMDIFMQAYEFPHNSVLLIDGDVIAVVIYTQMERRNSCFGGNYDKYANQIRLFFDNFSKSKVIPYVVFDGIAGPKKGDYSINLLKERIKKTTQLEYLGDDQNNIPIFVFEVFKCIVKELNIKMVMCNFDGDRDIASIANKLNCPILSNDSDFFIHDVKYIPFYLNNYEINLFVCRKIDKNREVNNYLKCMMFNRENFLKYTGLTLEKLPILSVYLGNKYIDYFTQLQANIPEFSRYLKLNSGHYLIGIINWLATQNTDEAIQIILNYFEDELKQEQIKNLIDEVRNDYSGKETDYFKYLLQDSDIIHSDISHNDHDALLDNVSSTFVNRYRKGFYHYYFLNILLFHKYDPKPFFEDINRDISHKLCFRIISAIHKILTNNSTEDLLFYGRQGADIAEQIIPKYQGELPYYEQLQEMDDENRLHYFFEILQIEEEFKQNCLELFPESWHILLITMKYMNKVTKVKHNLISSFIMSKIILSYVDKKLGHIRTRKDFDRFVSKYKGNTEHDDGNTEQGRNDIAECFHVTQAVEQISMPDSVNALEIFLPYFELSTDAENHNKLYNINLIHSLSEFQSCLLHVGFLNDLFCTPFKKCLMWECYNGTFVYNMLCQLESHQGFIYNLNLLDKSPTILRCFEFILALVKDQIV